MKGDADDPYELFLPGWAVDLIEAEKGVPVQEYVDEFFRYVVNVVVIR